MSAAPLKILVIDDEPPIRKLLRMGLSTQGYDILDAPNGKTALSLLDSKPDLVILDLGLPDIQGHDLLRMIRARDDSVPIVVLSSRGDEAGKVQALDLGADDYITKPFSQRLLLARIRAVLRRASHEDMDPTGPNIVRQGELLMDPDRHLCSWKGKEVRLTVTEFLILQALAARPGMVKNRDQLMDAAYGESVFLDDRTIDSHIKRLRRKIKAQDSSFDHIETLYGIGYKYRAS